MRGIENNNKTKISPKNFVQAGAEGVIQPEVGEVEAEVEAELPEWSTTEHPLVWKRRQVSIGQPCIPVGLSINLKASCQKAAKLTASPMNQQILTSWD